MLRNQNVAGWNAGSHRRDGRIQFPKFRRATTSCERSAEREKRWLSSKQGHNLTDRPSAESFGSAFKHIHKTYEETEDLKVSSQLTHAKGYLYESLIVKECTSRCIKGTDDVDTTT